MKKYIAVAAFSLLLSAILLRAPGTYDVTENWLPWMLILKQEGLRAGYAQIGDMYPPGTAALLMLADAVLPTLPDLTVIDLLIGLAQLGAGIAFARRTTTGKALGFVAAIAVSGAGLAYLDVLYALPLLLALFAALDRHPLASAACYAVACLIKWQPLILLPFMVVIWLDQVQALPRRRAAAGLGLLSIAALFILAAFWPAIWLAFAAAMDSAPWSGDALNLAWLAQLVFGYPPEPLFLVTNHSKWLLRLLFAAIYLPILLAAIRTQRHDPARMLVFGMAGFAAYFLLGPSVHENHLFVPVVLGFVLWTRLPRLAPAVVATAALFNINLLLFYGLTGTSPLPRDGFFALLTGTIAALALAAFAFVLWLLWRATRLAKSTGAAGSPPLLEENFGRMMP
ncbi:MAG: hypothetical protein JSR47_09050 [Proteobacteria bacterium]|nr:hypothetical protein [Pseudomonadota bacterium]